MTRTEIFIKIKKDIEDQYGGDVQLDSDFKDDLEMDSLDLQGLILNAERMFGITLDYPGPVHLTRIKDLVDMIEKELNKETR